MNIWSNIVTEFSAIITSTITNITTNDDDFDDDDDDNSSSNNNNNNKCHKPNKRVHAIKVWRYLRKLWRRWSPGMEGSW